MAVVTARDRLIVALDLPDVEAAGALVKQLGDGVVFYKIGLELAMAGGLDLARRLSGAGKRVFLDMKLLDIENTVERATRAAATTGAAFLTVHALDTKTLRAAVTGAAGTGLRILGVTVLTNLDGGDLAEQGIAEAPGDVVVRRARLASDAGCAGIVASGREAAPVRRALGPDATIVTPGIRAPGGAAGDQTRVVTPHAAIGAGADYLVVGRPITQAGDPVTAAAAFVQAIEEALAARPVSDPPGLTP
ncbi:MAG TPA: orotidine-5'-phosphate decarboxylase [Hyphomicrobiaceae bacterium]|nr:orotidine-5'-phosphate decarboxylase [Hyphomicrobiaceae bacterium]